MKYTESEEKLSSHRIPKSWAGKIRGKPKDTSQKKIYCFKPTDRKSRGHMVKKDLPFRARYNKVEDELQRV